MKIKLSWNQIRIPKGGVGAGDVVEAITKRLGIKPCAGCRKRKAWLNQKLTIVQKN